MVRDKVCCAPIFCVLPCIFSYLLKRLWFDLIFCTKNTNEKFLMKGRHITIHYLIESMYYIDDLQTNQKHKFAMLDSYEYGY